MSPGPFSVATMLAVPMPVPLTGTMTRGAGARGTQCELLDAAEASAVTGPSIETPSV